MKPIVQLGILIAGGFVAFIGITLANEIGDIRLAILALAVWPVAVMLSLILIIGGAILTVYERKQKPLKRREPPIGKEH